MTILLLCLKIFFARIIDVCLGTFRTVLIIKGKKLNASIIAFFELLIWYLVAREALTTNIDSIFIPIAYASGFATGTFLGMFLSNYYIGGHLTLNIISNLINDEHIEIIKKRGFGISTLNMENDKKMIIIGIDKKYLNELKELIRSIDERAFITINETKYVQNGFMK